MMRYQFPNILLTVIFLLTPHFCLAGVDFDGTDDYILVLHSSSLNLLNNFTISAWINTNALNDIVHRIIHKNAAYNFLIDSSNSRLRVYHYGMSVAIYSNSNVLNENTWHHVVYVQSSSAGVTLYVDGQNAGGDAGKGANVPQNGLPVYIGIDEDLSSYPFDGTINEVAIWDTVLSATDIEILYKSKIKGMPLQIKPDNLVAYWPLDDICDGCDLAGATFLDRKGTNNGTGYDANASGGQGKGEEILSYPE